jgi:hypothetical protein
MGRSGYDLILEFPLGWIVGAALVAPLGQPPASQRTVPTTPQPNTGSFAPRLLNFSAALGNKPCVS